MDKEKKIIKIQIRLAKGYGAFTHSRSQLDTVAKYVLNQEAHHQKKSFREEYIEMLMKNEVEYKEEYLFDFFENTCGWE